MRRRRWLLACLVGALSSGAGVARAEDPSKSEWSVGEALVLTPGRCLTAAPLATAIVGSLKRDQIDARLRVIVNETADEVSVDIEREGALVGSRVLPVRELRCETALALVGFTAAAALDATAIAEGQEPTERPRPPRPPAPLPTWPEAPPPPPRAEPPTRPARLSAFLEGGAIANLVRGVSFGAEVGGQVRLWGSLDVRLGVMQTVATSLPMGAGSTDVQLLAGELVGCGVVHTGVLVLRPCLGAWVGRLLGKGQGFPESFRAELPFAAVLARVDAAFPLSSHVSVVLFATAWGSPTNASFEARTLRGRPAYRAELPGIGVVEGAGVSVAF